MVPKFGGKSAFTLVELMVVISIIAILASLLLSGLSRAKGSAQKAVCINNLKQIQLAHALYAEGNRGRIVINGMGEILPPPMQLGCWVMGLMGHDDTGDAANRQSTNTSLLVGHRDALFSPYIVTARSYKCPADRSTVKIGGKRYARVRSYTMDQYLGHYLNRFQPIEMTGGAWFDEPGLRTGPGRQYYDRESDLAARNPANIWVMIDDHEDSIFFPEFRGGHERGGDWGAGVPASRHHGSGVLSFADGHVEAKKWVDPGTKRPVTGILGHGYPPRPGNNLDKSWLVQRYPPFYTEN